MMTLPFDLLLDKDVNKREDEKLTERNQMERSNCLVCNEDVEFSTKNLHKFPLYGELSDAKDDQHWILSQKCTSCWAVLGVLICGEIWKPHEILRTDKPEYDGLRKVESYAERVVLFILSQVIFKQDASKKDSEDLTYLCPGPDEYGKIIWKNGQAAGFYTMKLKGSVYTSSIYSVYQLPVIDLVYVRTEFRRQGLASDILKDVVQMYPNEDIGFSEPVSENMLLVIAKYLQVHADRRDHIWEVSWTGCEGYKTNIWLLIRRLRRDHLLK